MGFFDLFKQQPQIPQVVSMLPSIVKKELANGRLPILKTSKVFLNQNEYCYYLDNCIYEKRVVRKKYVRHGGSYSIPGLFKGTRMHVGGGQTDVEDNIKYEQINGMLCITNNRIIFISDYDGFEKNISKLTAITPYSNCVKIQFEKDTYTFFIPDGNIVNRVLQLIK